MIFRGGQIDRAASTSSRLAQMLHMPAAPMELNTESLPGRSFVLPSPTNVSLLNFPFASPDINEPGSPLGYDLNSSLLDQNLENFSNSLLDINESADAHGLHFSPSSDLNLSPQDSPCFTLFTGPALELGLPYNPGPPDREESGQPQAREESTLDVDNAGRQPDAFVPAPPVSSSQRPNHAYADLSVDSIIQQKREDVFWAASFFFSHFFELVCTSEAEDLNISLEDPQTSARAKQIDRQVFLVQNDMENMYMWYLSARPANALGRMQLQSFISGRHQLSRAAFPFTAARGFVRSHKLQRKKYKGLSNPQCIHGLRVVNSPSFSHVSEEERKKFEGLTSRPLGTPLSPEAADYNTWRKVPDRPEAALQSEASSPAEPLSQVIDFLPNQSAQLTAPQHAGGVTPDLQESRHGGRASKRRKKGAMAVVGATEATGAPHLPGTPNLRVPENGDVRAHALPEQPPERIPADPSAVPVTDLTLQWQAEIERDRARLWDFDASPSPASPVMSAHESTPHRGLLGRAQGPPRTGASRLGREARVRRREVQGTESAPPNGPAIHQTLSKRNEGVGGPGHGSPSNSELDFQQRTGRDSAFQPKYALQPAALLSPGQEAQQGSSRAATAVQQEGEPLLVETVSEEHVPVERDADESAATEQQPRFVQQPLLAREAPPQARADVVVPPGSVLRTQKSPFDAQHASSSEAVYEDEQGYLVFLPLPFSNLKKVALSWRNVGETGVVKVVRQQPSAEITRGERTLRLVVRNSDVQELPREIFLPSRIPDDALLEAQYSAECAGLEVSVPKHAACTEERPVRLFLPDQPQSLRGT